MFNALTRFQTSTLRKAARRANKSISSTGHHLQVRAMNGHSSPNYDDNSKTKAMNGHSSTSHDLKPCNTFLGSRGTTIFSVMTNLSVQHSSVNLGQVWHYNA